MKIDPLVILDEYMLYIQLERNYSSYTASEYKTDIAEFLSFLSREGIQELDDVTYIEARLYVTELYHKSLARTSISRKISSIRSFFKFANVRYQVSDHAFTALHHPKKQEKIPSFFYEKEMELLFKACQGKDPKSLRERAILELLYATGMRVSELTALKIEDVDEDLGIVKVMGKGKKERYLPFGSFAIEAISSYLNEGRPRIIKEETHNFLFVNMRGKPLTEHGVSYILKQIMERASLHTKIHPHMLRHTFATHLLENGADMRTVQELLGHAHLSSTQVYTHMTKEYLRKTYMNTHPRA